MSYLAEIQQHAQEIKKLPTATRNLVIDALRVRAMDFVTDRLHSDLGDMTADVIRELIPSADTNMLFDPSLYADPALEAEARA